MKLQCACGAKYAFDAKPEMVSQPVKFICPSCGLDSSDFVNQLIRQEFGQNPPPPPVPSAPPPSSSVPPPPPPPPPPPAAGRLRISVEAASAPAAAPEAPASKYCAKHRELVTEKCAVCQKPICPKCLEMFGFFCSPLCKSKAQDQHLDVPVYAGQRDAVEATFWRKAGLVAGGIGLLVVLFLGGWIWYAWFGSVPHPYFSVRFEDNDRGYAGHSKLVGKDQIVFLHGGTLARYNLNTSKPVWSQELITPQQIADVIKAENEAEAQMSTKGYHHSGETSERTIKQMLQAALTLHVSGQNIWVENGPKITHYDWDTGKVANEVSLPEFGGELVEKGDELQMVGELSVTHISLATGESHVEQFAPPGAKSAAPANNVASGGLPGTPGGNGQPMDPQKVEAQAQNLKLQGRLALPAMLSYARHEQQLEEALKEDLGKAKRAAGLKTSPAETEFQLVAGKTGFVQFSSRLLEEREVTRAAMKAPPKQSALNGDLNATKTAEVANEILNEMQRNAGGDTVTEDASRYQVTVHLPEAGSTDWTGEVVGSPQLFVLDTVNVVAAGKGLIVLDKSNKKLWEASLTYAIPETFSSRLFARGTAAYGEGPCVEHGDTLYVFDQAVLTAFELTSGNARWRLPSVGVVGLFFDDQNNVYVNTTTGNPDDIKYARQIDINRNTQPVVSKINSQTGKTLWSVKPNGYVSYLSGKFIYVIDSHDPNPSDVEALSDMTISVQKDPFLRITRLRPSDGKIMWEYYDRGRAPVSWRFEDNNIELIFKREVQVLRYLTF